jgi:hypothetical protein
VNWDDLTRVAPLATEDAPLVRSHQGGNQVQFPCNRRVVRVVDPKPHRRAVLCSTAGEGDALTLSRDDKARVHLELLCRDAKPVTGVCDRQARSQAKLDFHFKASWTAVTRATREARPQHRDAMASCSLASRKRRAFNQHLIARSGDHVARGHRVDQSSPDDEALCHDGSSTALAA